jgi:uncharacterized protein (TIGR00369 family)
MADLASPDLQAMFRRAPFVADVGAELLALGTGECESALALAPRHLQHTGQVHAGVLATLADHTAGAAAQTTLAPGSGYVVTAELKLSLLRAAQGDRLRCVARVIKPGRQIVFTEADVYCRSGEREQHVARLSATMAVVSAAG